MADDRDKRRRHTPHAGVRSQIAGRPGSDAETTPPMGSVPVPPEVQAVIDEQAMPRRVKETRDATAATLETVEQVRSELKNDIGRVERKVEEHGTVLLEQNTVLGELRQEVGKISGTVSGQIPLILDNFQTLREELQADRSAHRNLRVTAIQADIETSTAKAVATTEIDKTREITGITETQAKAQWRREMILKIVAGVGALWAVISATSYFTSC